MESTDHEFVARTSADLAASIWFRPTETFRYLLNYMPDRHVKPLLMLSAIANGFTQNEFADKNKPLVLTLVATIIGGGIFGYLLLKLYAFLLEMAGELLYGKSRGRQVKTVLAWSALPSIATLILLGLRIIVYGEDTFRTDLSFEPSSFTTGFDLIYRIAVVTLTFWSLFLLVIGLAEAQKFTIVKAIFNMIVAGMIIGIPAFFLLSLLLIF